MSRVEIIEKARELVRDNGGQIAVADRLGVKQPSISKALKSGDTSMDHLRARILAEFAGLRVLDEPHFPTEPLPKKGKKR